MLQWLTLTSLPVSVFLFRHVTDRKETAQDSIRRDCMRTIIPLHGMMMGLEGGNERRCVCVQTYEAQSSKGIITANIQ